MWLKSWFIVAVIAVFVVLSGCTPKAAPAPAKPVTAPTSAAPVQRPEDAAWDKVVQEAKKEGKVVSYSFSMAGDVGNAVSKAFKDKYGITLEVIGGTSPVLIQRIRAEQLQSQFVADIGDLSSGRVVELKTNNFTASLKDLPILKDRAPWYTHPFDQDPDGHVLMYYPNVLGIFANTNAVKSGDEPRSWQDVLDPKWKGKLIIADPGINQTASFLHQFFKKKGVYNDNQVKDLGGQFGKFIPGGQADFARALAQGEGALGVGLDQAGANPLIAQGAPLKALDLKEGFLGLPMGLAMLSKSPHPNASKVFINWLFSAEGLKVWAEAAKQATYRKDVPEFTPPAGKMDLSRVYTLKFSDMDDVNNIFNNKVVPNLWKK
ncbi:MAG: hypothetical protein HW384_214 [Dehalococcoidia bacterium]|nr:hypothetical protein [Dehalococcoidia bacterium]